MRLFTNSQIDVPHQKQSISIRLLYVFSLILAIVLPLILWRLRLPIIQATYDGSAPGTLESKPFELFSFFITTLMLVMTWLNIRQQPKKTWTTVLPVVLPLLVCINLLFIQVETFQARSSDYMCYENAARAILAGSNPYTRTPPCYLYPPFLAQVLASLHQIAVYNPFFTFKSELQAWTFVTYFYHCGKFIQVILAYYLTFLLARNLRVKPLQASLLVSALFLFNYPLVRTLTFDQVNLWLLNSFLLGIVLLQRYPIIAGLGVALGAHIKLYTLILLLPWAVTKRWRAIVGTIIGFIVIALIQTNWGQDWELWQQFLSYFRSPEKPSNYRNNGVWSLVFNLVKIPSQFLNTDVLFRFVPIVVVGINLVVLVWFAQRFIKREKLYVKLTKSIGDGKRNVWSDTFRFYGHSIDAIALSLLISPSVWEHHYVIAIPIALWAVITHTTSERPYLAFVGTFLIFCLPTFEVFPLSFYRLVGLLILVYLTAPECTQNYFLKTLKKIEVHPQL